MENSHRLGRSVSIRVKIALTTGVLAVIIWCILAGFSYRVTGVVLQTASQNMFDAATRSVNDAILSTYRPVERSTSILAFSLLGAANTVEECQALLPLLTEILEKLSTATAIQRGDINGNYFIVRKLQDTSLRLRFDAPKESKWVVDNIVGKTGAHTRRFYSEQLSEIDVRQLVSSEYDPRARPWFKASLNTQDTITTDPYVFFFMRSVGVTVARANRDKTAVIATDITLKSIAHSLQKNRITPSTESVLMTEQGVMVWSVDAPGLVDTNDGLRRPTLRELGVPVFNQIAAGVVPDDWLVHKSTLKLTDSISPDLLIAVPKAELLSELSDERNKLLIVSLAMLFLLIPVAWLLASRISTPLRELHRAISDVGKGNINFWLPSVKSKDEVGDLNLALRTMRQSLMQHVEDLATARTAREKMESELDVARRIQMSLVPGNGEMAIPLGQDELYARLLPARAVGGDLYETIRLPDGRYFIAVGDVSDKGIPAALFMSRACTLAKLLIPRETSLAELVASLNDELEEGNDACMFITLFCAIYDSTTGHLQCVCAGHNPPMIVNAEGTVMMVIATGAPLGLFPGNEYLETNTVLDFGERLVIYTDGITEAFDPRRNEFTDVRLFNLLTDQGVSNTVTEAGEELLKAVSDFSGEADQSDDITLMILDRKTLRAESEYRAEDDRTDETGFSLPAPFTFKVPLDLSDSAFPVRDSVDALQRFGMDHQIPSAVIEELMVVLDEVISNIVKYSQDPTGEASLLLTLEQKAIVFKFVDQGIPFNPLGQSATDLDVPAEDLAEGGMGIQLILSMTDHQVYERVFAMNVLTLSRNLLE
ncbi:SpoIIE family protein phosphatase [Pseudomaricurvus sp.]|uniref:SpoIIE family protein phosphatase n=1 Tax=Pseudomaricurvus sp. TaxID=2004510 RepID=UPI003F6D8D4E